MDDLYLDLAAIRNAAKLIARVFLDDLARRREKARQAQSTCPHRREFDDPEVPCNHLRCWWRRRGMLGMLGDVAYFASGQAEFDRRRRNIDYHYLTEKKALEDYFAAKQRLNDLEIVALLYRVERHVRSRREW
ncbi:MAG: hypothetical protein AB7S38_28860 [Vulcanimicrobiota bacterium]